MVQGLELVGIYIFLEVHKQYSKIIESGRSQYNDLPLYIEYKKVKLKIA